ncbi:hypothetical protein nbrc107696_43110 [Gordonia spumicola]|uniref:Cytochrome c oxidase assembly protein n=1 Tax=Gordonia spumicola TaxID=589161 RepID=A0A7I9VEZ3_9ACTN|nr:cytochrome c oxidase assembly protein [Gordonia spumicola]GEE03865.1 hypothetical protein nbrc107696_43110 [Gordonia spumicola]
MHHHGYDCCAITGGTHLPLPVLALCAVLAIAVIGYAVVATQLGDRWPARRIGWFALGAASVASSCLIMADGSQPLLGHVASMVVAPVFLVLARPLRMVLRGCAADDRRRVARLAIRLRRMHLHNRPTWVAAEYVLSMAFMVSPAMMLLGSSLVVHLAMMLYMVACGIGFFRTVLGVPIWGTVHPRAVRARIAWAATAGMALIGWVLTMWPAAAGVTTAQAVTFTVATVGVTGAAALSVRDGSAAHVSVRIAPHDVTSRGMEGVG